MGRITIHIHFLADVGERYLAQATRAKTLPDSPD